MASRFVVLAAALVASQAGPVWYIDNGIPGTVFYREARAPDFAAPSLAYAFGSGFSSNVAGISHSSGIGASFRAGDAEAYGAGSAGSDGHGHGFARGTGYANTSPSQQLYRTNYPYGYPAYNGQKDSYGNAVSSAQTLGNYGSAVAQTQNAPYNFRNAGYGSALATSSGYGSSATSSSDGSGTAISSAQSRDASGYNSAVSASQNRGGVQAHTAHSTQLQHGGALRQAGSTTYQGPGIQAAHTSVINAAPGYY